MPEQKLVAEDVDCSFVKIKSLRKVENEDVYCLASENNGTMVANGIVTRQCDSLRYVMNTHKVSLYDPYAHAASQENFLRNKYTVTR